MPDSPTRVQAFLNRLSAMVDLSGDGDFSGLLIDNGDAGHFRAGIDFELKIRRLNIRDLSPQDDGEWRATNHSGFASRKKPASHRRVTRRKGLFVGV
jgi:hypothetical protein